MSEPMSDRGENGERLCPLTLVEREYDEATDSYSAAQRPCREPLHLVDTRWVGLFHNEAYTGSYDDWKVECEHGHVLLTSPSDPDASVPFTTDLLLFALAMSFRPLPTGGNDE